MMYLVFLYFAIGLVISATWLYLLANRVGQLNLTDVLVTPIVSLFLWPLLLLMAVTASGEKIVWKKDEK